MELRCKLIVAYVAYLFLPCILHAQFPKTLDLANFGEDVRIVYHTEDDKDGFGKDLATGDFNGDGYDDILAGAYTYSDRENLRFNVGRAYIVFGGPALPRILDLGHARARSVRITGDDPWDNTGFYVGSGDVNGDGFEEAIVGSIQVGSVTTPGKLYVVYGRQSWPEEFDLNTNGGAVEGITRITGKLPGNILTTRYTDHRDRIVLQFEGEPDVRVLPLNLDEVPQVMTGPEWRLDIGIAWRPLKNLMAALDLYSDGGFGAGLEWEPLKGIYLRQGINRKSDGLFKPEKLFSLGHGLGVRYGAARFDLTFYHSQGRDIATAAIPNGQLHIRPKISGDRIWMMTVLFSVK